MTRGDALGRFQPAVGAWFRKALGEPTTAQELGFQAIEGDGAVLIAAPTGSGKTLAAFLTAIDRLMFSPEPAADARLRVLYVSPLKALGADVERNLRLPLEGVAAEATRLGVPFRRPTIAIRTGDTPPSERARFRRRPDDVLITTPESLYLLLTSQARERLASVETVIVDEIHALAGTKRGVHLALSLERLEDVRGRRPPLKRIGLSATVRPLEAAASFLAGGTTDGPDGSWRPRPYVVVDARAPKALDLVVAPPLDATAEDDRAKASPSSPNAFAPAYWPAAFPRIVERARGSRSTIVFVNSRRLAERVAAGVDAAASGAVADASDASSSSAPGRSAGPFARAHHGSMSKELRTEAEEALKRGALPCLVATSTLELGIDMGAVDLVVQIEAPPSIASGLQRVGRAGHRAGETSRGVFLPKFRHDLLATAAATRGMLDGAVEETRCPKNALDVLTQQIVAEVAVAPRTEDDLYALARRAAPYAELPRSAFDAVLAMAAGEFSGDAFFEIRPRVVRDEKTGVVRARVGAGRIAVQNAGVIPDRGVYGVFLAGTEPGRPSRVGELDEEMVFETALGDVIVLGASSWRVVEITHDRVLVTPAPGEPGRTPFWKADGLGRPAEFGRAIGALARALAEEKAPAARRRLRERHGFEKEAASILVAYVEEQKAALGVVPNDEAIVLERFDDELGDRRVVVHSPYGGRVHAPWCAVVLKRLRATIAPAADAIWTDDGLAFRLPASEAAPDPSAFLLDPDDVERLVIEALSETQVFAARFRENAARALLLPRKAPGVRTPLWMQRKRALDLLAAAARAPTFPITLETVRDCLKDAFDVPALIGLMKRIREGAAKVAVVDVDRPSPFATNVLFTWTGSFLYDGDAALAERRAQALTLDHKTLRELLGDSDLRSLLDAKALEALERRWAGLDPKTVRNADDVRDLLRRLGDLSKAEIRARIVDGVDGDALVRTALQSGRVVEATIAGEPRLLAREDRALYFEACGVRAKPPDGAAAALDAPDPPDAVAPPDDALGTLLLRFARGRGPFTAAAAAARFGLGEQPTRDALRRLVSAERLVDGALRPGGASDGREWCDPENLRALKAKSLAVGRATIEPVDAPTYCRFLVDRHRFDATRTGPEGVLAALDRLEGTALAATTWFDDALPFRVLGFRPWQLDRLCSDGVVVWRGAGRLSSKNGRVAFARADALDALPPPPPQLKGAYVDRIRDVLARRGAVFFAELSAEMGAFQTELLDALWDLVWNGEVANDGTTALRARIFPMRARVSDAAISKVAGLRRVRAAPLGGEGRWSLVAPDRTPPDPTRRAVATAKRMVERYGVLVRDAAAAEGVEGGFSAIYPALRALEERGVLKRGYFVDGRGAAQFAVQGAADRLREFRSSPTDARALVLDATDPAQPYGALLPWPTPAPAFKREAGARVVLFDGAPIGRLAKNGRVLWTTLPPDADLKPRALSALAEALAFGEAPMSRLLAEIDGVPASSSPFAPAFIAAGFKATSRGLLRRFSSVDARAL